MNFNLLAVVCLSATAAAIACLLVPLFNLIFRKPKTPGRFTASTVLFSVAITALALILVFIPNPLEKLKSLLQVKNIIYYSLIMALVFATTIFYRHLIPIVALLYIAYCFLFTFYLYTSFTRRNIPYELTLEDDTLTYRDTVYPLTNPAPEQSRFLVIKTLSLSDKLLLPLPRMWFQPVEVIDSRTDFLSESNLSLETDNLYTTHLVFRPLEILAKKTGSEISYLIEIPDGEFHPIVYTLNLSSTDNVFSYELLRLF